MESKLSVMERVKRDEGAGGGGGGSWVVARKNNQLIIKGSTCGSYNFLQEAEEVAEEPLGDM